LLSRVARVVAALLLVVVARVDTAPEPALA
jgi:hypothetical protein